MTTSTPPDTTSIDPATLRRWVEQHDDLFVIDVRGAAEFESVHIHGSYHVPLPLLREHAPDVASRVGNRVVLVCQSGARAEQARQRLGVAGMDGALVLSGGVPAYAAAGGDVVRGRGPWAMERQVRMAAGSLVLTSVLAGELVSPLLSLVAGFVGAGLAYSAATNSCAMGRVLSWMPWNRSANEPTAQHALAQLSGRA
jgi:rhodanese-related sulfurtransferase